MAAAKRPSFPLAHHTLHFSPARIPTGLVQDPGTSPALGSWLCRVRLAGTWGPWAAHTFNVGSYRGGGHRGTSLGDLEPAQVCPRPCLPHPHLPPCQLLAGHLPTPGLCTFWPCARWLFPCCKLGSPEFLPHNLLNFLPHEALPDCTQSSKTEHGDGLDFRPRSLCGLWPQLAPAGPRVLCRTWGSTRGAQKGICVSL